MVIASALTTPMAIRAPVAFDRGDVKHPADLTPGASLRCDRRTGSGGPTMTG
jgi:hypothetical protein